MTNPDKVFAAVLAHWRENAIPPTIRHVQQATGINSTSLVRSCYLKLEKQGVIKRIKSKPVPVQIYRLLIEIKTKREI